MSLNKSNLIQTSSSILIYCLLTSNSLFFPVLVFPTILYLNHKQKLNSEMSLFLLHLLPCCFMVSTAESGWQERFAWLVVICQGWILGLRCNFQDKILSIVGKVVTLVWLNYFYGFDILSPNYIPYIPIVVSKIYSKTEKVEENDDNEIIVTDTHCKSANPLYTLPYVCKFTPLEKSPAISKLFYHSDGGVYTYEGKNFKVISLINGAKVYLQVETILD